jgi:hypothetical protein
MHTCENLLSLTSYPPPFIVASCLSYHLAIHTLHIPKFQQQTTPFPAILSFELIRHFPSCDIGPVLPSMARTDDDADGRNSQDVGLAMPCSGKVMRWDHARYFVYPIPYRLRTFLFMGSSSRVTNCGRDSRLG